MTNPALGSIGDPQPTHRAVTPGRGLGPPARASAEAGVDLVAVGPAPSRTAPARSAPAAGFGHQIRFLAQGLDRGRIGLFKSGAGSTPFRAAPPAFFVLRAGNQDSTGRARRRTVDSGIPGRGSRFSPTTTASAPPHEARRRWRPHPTTVPRAPPSRPPAHAGNQTSHIGRATEPAINSGGNNTNSPAERASPSGAGATRARTPRTARLPPGRRTRAHTPTRPPRKKTPAAPGGGGGAP